MIHFGAHLRQKAGGFYLTRENYITVNPNSSLVKGQVYDPICCQKHAERCLRNFDLNMEYFNTLDSSEFNQELRHFLARHPEFFEIKDLSEVIQKSGYYILVLDKYRQMYVGTSIDIKTRIMSHWSKTKPFDRLIWGDVESSILSIDSFRALDTTRIFVAIGSSYLRENSYIEDIDRRYLLNRTAGGIMENGLVDAAKHARTRNLCT